MKPHLLYPDRDLDLSTELPINAEDLVGDLQLDVLIHSMAGDDGLVARVAERAILRGLTDPAEIRYRQGILRDFLERPDILEFLYAAAGEALAGRKNLWGYTFHKPSSVVAGALRYLEMFVGHLKALRSFADDHKAVVRSDGLVALFGSLQAELSDDYFATVQEHLDNLKFREGMLLEARLAGDNTGEGYLLLYPGQGKRTWRRRIGAAPRDSFSFSVNPRDDAGAQALEDLTNRGMNQVANALAQSADHITSYFTLMRAELAFYVGCLNLHSALAEARQPACFPEITPMVVGALTFSDLRDPCLALQASHDVVGNDVRADGKSLIVITGANSGGKSTFLRSVGAAQLMMQAGMFVPAASYLASSASGVFTHFSREEDPTMTKGRLVEELGRFRGLVGHIHPGALVLLNEAFHSTNEREGSEISRQIVRALQEAGSRVMVVTHQYDFANSVYQEMAESVLSLRAERRADGQRDYKLVAAQPLETAFGRDLYHRIFADARAACYPQAGT